MSFHFFFFNDTATTEIYTLPLHDALPISAEADGRPRGDARGVRRAAEADRRAQRQARRARRPPRPPTPATAPRRSEEHTSELQSQSKLVCRLLLEKKKNSYYVIVFRR